MSGEHDTPIGTPVVIAPGKVFLVGEYAVLDEGCAVLAAITRYAKAQFMPRTDSMPPLVRELVRRTKADLGEAASALPPGVVFVNTDDFQLGPAGGLGSSAAIAVATVGAVYESLGLAIEERKVRISAIADAGRRVIQGDVGSGADTAAATCGGLIAITRRKDALPHIDCLASPAGLHLVLFSAGRSISTRQMAAGLREYAKREPVAFARAMGTLREIARRFVSEVTAGHATGAVVTAGKYGDELAKLSLAASVPILTDAFVRASNLAQAFGGIAKPTGAGGGEVGVAMFATPEAARFFRKACTDPLTPLEGDIEPLGVRCWNPEIATDNSDSDEEFLSTPSPEPSEVSLPPVVESVPVEWPAEGMDTVPDGRVLAPEIEASTPQRTSRPRTQVVRKRILPAAAIILAAVVTWFTFPKPIGALGHGSPPAPSAREGAGSPIALPQNADPTAERPSSPKDADKPAATSPRQASPEVRGRPTSAYANSHGRRGEPSRLARVAPTQRPPTVTVPDAPVRATKPSARRAGNLSVDDF